MKNKLEQIESNGKKTLSWTKVGYFIFILTIIISLLLIVFIKIKAPEPIDFTTNGAIGMEEEQYAYLNVQGLSTEIENSSTNDSYYIAYSGGYMYVVNLEIKTKMQLKSWQNYTNSEEENLKEPKTETIYGTTETISDELKQKILDYYNEGLSEQYQIEEYEFESYFGSVLLNVRRDVGNIFVPKLMLLVAIIGIIILFITKKKKSKRKSHLDNIKKN